jgi:bromodomain adjacent to zinc finger domain protein 1A
VYRFEEFLRPVDTTEVPDYRAVIHCPMDFESMMHKLNSSEYFTAGEFIKDIHLIVSNCLAYNPDNNESDKVLIFFQSFMSYFMTPF